MCAASPTSHILVVVIVVDVVFVDVSVVVDVFVVFFVNAVFLFSCFCCQWCCFLVLLLWY